MHHPLAEHLLPDVNGPQRPFDRLVYVAAALAVIVGVARLFT
ncbi:hypothetical protein [Sinorhizobium meliloti]|nr:hypothetical protein [Sinorhizobium meliloti]